MTADPKLVRTLDIVSEAADLLADPWWIIGSAAAVLIGLDDDPVDVDLLTGEADAHRLLEAWDVQRASPTASTLFHSSVYATAVLGPLPIELMASLRVRGERLVPKTRHAVPWGRRRLYVPELPEQIAILELFGREKDLRRAERLRRMV